MAFLAVVGVVANAVGNRDAESSATVAGSTQPASVDPAEAERCKVPDFAKAMGHEEKWKLHNNCK